jgi:hypothetical protein
MRVRRLSAQQQQIFGTRCHQNLSAYEQVGDIFVSERHGPAGIPAAEVQGAGSVPAERATQRQPVRLTRGIEIDALIRRHHRIAHEQAMKTGGLVLGVQNRAANQNPSITQGPPW